MPLETPRLIAARGDQSRFKHQGAPEGHGGVAAPQAGSDPRRARCSGPPRRCADRTTPASPRPPPLRVILSGRQARSSSDLESRPRPSRSSRSKLGQALGREDPPPLHQRSSAGAPPIARDRLDPRRPPGHPTGHLDRGDPDRSEATNIARSHLQERLPPASGPRDPVAQAVTRALASRGVLGTIEGTLEPGLPGGVDAPKILQRRAGRARHRGGQGTAARIRPERCTTAAKASTPRSSKARVKTGSRAGSASSRSSTFARRGVGVDQVTHLGIPRPGGDLGVGPIPAPLQLGREFVGLGTENVRRPCLRSDGPRPARGGAGRRRPGRGPGGWQSPAEACRRAAGSRSRVSRRSSDSRHFAEWLAARHPRPRERETIRGHGKFLVTPSSLRLMTGRRTRGEVPPAGPSLHEQTSRHTQERTRQRRPAD